MYRNFPGRLELLEALYNEEVNALCAVAESHENATPSAAFTEWLHRFFAFVPSKRLIISELLQHADRSNPILGRNRARVLDAGQALLVATQNAGEVRDDLTLEQILDMIVAIARTPGNPGYLKPMFEVTLNGLRPPAVLTDP